MINWIDERYAKNAMKLQQSYYISLFTQYRDRQVLQALDIILGRVTQIEVDEAIVRMAQNIVEGYVCYDFFSFLLNEIRKKLLSIDKADFKHTSYLWWLIFHQNLQILVDRGLSTLLQLLHQLT